MEPKNGAQGADTGGRGAAKAVAKFNAQEFLNSAGIAKHIVAYGR
jgi:hypothetical protein